MSRYFLELYFDTGDVKVLDLEALMWGPVFEPLRASYEVFCKVFVDQEAGTIAWPNGADFAPDELYRRSRASIPEPPSSPNE